MKDTTPIYFHSAAYAHEHGELEQYNASHKANIACRDAIEQAIADNYGDNRLNPACVRQAAQQFDSDRIFYVLANTVRHKDHDGRISRDNKAWAQTVPVCEDKDGFGYDRNVYFIVDRCNPGLTDLFLSQARREYAPVQEQKTSVRGSLNKHAGQQAHSDRAKVKKEPER